MGGTVWTGRRVLREQPVQRESVVLLVAAVLVVQTDSMLRTHWVVVLLPGRQTYKSSLRVVRILGRCLLVRKRFRSSLLAAALVDVVAHDRPLPLTPSEAAVLAVAESCSERGGRPT